MSVKIYYGIPSGYIDVSSILMKDYCYHGVIIFPSDDNYRAKLFTDPFVGKHKYMFVSFGDIENSFYACSGANVFKLDLNDLSEYQNYKPKRSYSSLEDLKSDLQLCFGNFNDEIVEQTMSFEKIRPDAKVLELGTNIGRNSLVISSLLNDDSNFVTLECGPSYKEAVLNRNINGRLFHIENAALSLIPLAQKNWDTIPYEGQLPKGYTDVNIISYTQLKQKYSINFDTLVVDCEGALYYILRDMPEILDGITTILLENDYTDISHYVFIAAKLVEHKFKKTRDYIGGWGPCRNFFWQVWEK